MQFSTFSSTVKVGGWMDLWVMMTRSPLSRHLCSSSPSERYLAALNTKLHYGVWQVLTQSSLATKSISYWVFLLFRFVRLSNFQLRKGVGKNSLKRVWKKTTAKYSITALKCIIVHSTLVYCSAHYKTVLLGYLLSSVFSAQFSPRPTIICHVIQCSAVHYSEVQCNAI